MDHGKNNAAKHSNEPPKRTKDQVADEGPRIKRQRVSRACDQCRAGREKCDGIKPKCGTCAFSERACTYDTQAKKRGIQPGYIRTLELSLAWLFSKYPESESTLKRELAIEDSQVQKLLTSKEGSESDRLHIRWSKGVVCKQIDQLLSGVEVSSPSQFGPENDVSGSGDLLTDIFPIEDHSVVDQQNNGPSNAFNVRSLPNVSISDIPKRSSLPAADTVQETNTLHLPADFWRLLDVYYSFTHSWLPISEKHDILKTAYSYPPEGLRVESSDIGSGNHAELWAVLALAAHQSNPRKDQNEIDMSMIVARNLLPAESGPFELGHVRALLLLSLIYIGRGERAPAWILTGFAIRVAYELRLHKRADLHLPRRKHVYLACYVLEAILGKLYGVPTHLRGQGVDPLVLLEEDGLEEWNPWDGGIIVTSQLSLGLSRKPAQSISIFNRVLGALRDDERAVKRPDQHTDSQATRSQPNSNTIISAHPRGPPPLERRSSNLRQVHGLNRRESLDDADPWTPQQLHLELIELWLCSEQILSSAKTAWPRFVQRLKVYIQCFGASRIPPTAVPLLERLAGLLDLDVKEITFRNMLGSLTHTWRKEVPIQAIAFQTTPGQDASPASVLGETFGSGHLYGMSNSLHQLNSTNPSIYNTNFGIDSNPYLAFPPGPESQQMQQPGLMSKHQIPPNTGLVSGNTSMPGPTQQGPAADSAPTMEYIPHEQTQTADLEAIFEEIAMLDGNRQDSDRPEFMRNLGLGPDLDLSAFFGADYQSTDPLFSYLQPDTFGDDTDNVNMYRNS